MSKSLLADDREDYVFGALVKGVTKLAQAAGKNLGNKAEQAVIKNSKKYKTLIDELTTDNAEGAGVVYTKAELKDFEKGADGFYDLVLEVLQELRTHKSMHDLQANELIDSGVKPASVKRILSRDIEDVDLTEGERSIRNKFMTKYFPMDQDGMENMLFPSDRYFSVGAGPPSRKPILIEHAAGKEPKAIGGLMNQSKESKSKGGRMKSNSMKIKYDKGSKVDKRRSAKGWDELAELERDLQQHERIVKSIYEPQEREESSFVEDWNRIRDKNRMTLLKDAEKRIESPYSKYTDRIDAHIRSIYSEAKKNTVKEAGEKSRKRESDPEPEEVPISKSPPSGATYGYDLPRGVHKASGGSMLVPPEMEIEEQEMPVDTYPNIPPDEMAAAEASQLPDEQMEDKHLEYVLDEALDPEDQEYLMGVLETDERLSNIFDKVMDVAAEFSGEGEVDGPGTGVSDSVPARLSDGEFVFTKKATDQIGSDQLQTMMDDAERAYDGGYMKKAFGGLTLDPMDNEKSYGVEQMNETQNELRKQMLGANRMPSVLR